MSTPSVSTTAYSSLPCTISYGCTPVETILKEHIKTIEAWNKQQQEQIEDYKKRLENVGKGSEKMVECLVQTHEAAVMVLQSQIESKNKAIKLLEKERDEARTLFAQEQKYVNDLIKERDEWKRMYNSKYFNENRYFYKDAKSVPKGQTVTTQTLVTPLSQAIPCDDKFDAAMDEAGLTPLPSQEEEATRL